MKKYLDLITKEGDKETFRYICYVYHDIILKIIVVNLDDLHIVIDVGVVNSVLDDTFSYIALNMEKFHNSQSNSPLHQIMSIARVKTLDIVGKNDILISLLNVIPKNKDKEKFKWIYNNYKYAMFYIANCILHNSVKSEFTVHDALLYITMNIHKISDVNSDRTKYFTCLVAKFKAVIKDESEDYAIDQLYLVDISRIIDPDIKSIANVITRMYFPCLEVMELYIVYRMNQKEIAQLFGIPYVLFIELFRISKKEFEACLNDERLLDNERLIDNQDVLNILREEFYYGYYDILVNAWMEVISLQLENIPPVEEIKQRLQFSVEFYEKKFETHVEYINRMKYNRIMRAAASILLLFILLGSSATVYKEVTEKKHGVYGTTLKEYIWDKNTLNVTVDTMDDKTEIEIVYLPEYIPKSYKIADEMKGTGFSDAIYSNGNQDIIIKQRLIDYMAFTIDNECTEQEKILIRGNEAIFYIKNNELSIVWCEFGYTFQIESNKLIAKEELIKIAKSLNE